MLTHLNCQSYYLGNFFITLREWTLKCFSLSMSKNYMVMCFCVLIYVIRYVEYVLIMMVFIIS